VCVRLAAQDDVLGVLHIRYDQAAPNAARWIWLASAVADHLSLALANLRLREQLREHSIRDQLTGLFNRRYLQEQLEVEILRAEHQGYAIGLIVLDIDHFKQYNTQHGLGGGDAVLREVGAFLRRSIKGKGIACRYGGEEFTLVLPQASLQSTVDLAEQVRSGIKRVTARHNNCELQSVSVSLGVALFPEHGSGLDAIIESANQALRTAKATGRDKVLVGERVTFE
jgi:diguanylate cyclase (GGDEF)-like protein